MKKKQQKQNTNNAATPVTPAPTAPVRDKKPKKPAHQTITAPQFGDPVRPEVLLAKLAHNSMTIKVTAGAWNGTKSDKDWATILAGSAGGNVDGFSVTLKCLPPTMRTELGQKTSKIRRLVTANGIPWMNGGTLIATSIYKELKTHIEAAQQELRDYVEQMATNRQSIVDYAKAVLGKAYHDERIPTADELRQSIKIAIEIGDVHVPTELEGMNNEDLEEVRQSIMDNVKRQYNAGILELVDSLREVLERMYKEMEEKADTADFRRTFEMARDRIGNIQRLDVFDSRRVKMALEHICEEVLLPWKEALDEAERGPNKEKRGKMKEAALKLKDGVKKAAKTIDELGSI